MYLYSLFILLSIFSALEISKIKIKQIPDLYSILYWVFVIILICISTFRWENGTDWDSYYSYFLLQDKITCFGYMEPGFTLLTSINSVLFNYTAQLGAVACLSILPIAVRFKKLTQYPLFALFVWFCIFFANIFPVRQSIAVALFVYSWKYIENKEFTKFIIIILIASTFHITAITTLPIYYIWHYKLSLKFIIVSLCLLAIISFSFKDLMSNLIFLIGGDFFKSKLEFYIGENSETTFGAAYSLEQIILRGSINKIITFIFPLILLNKIRLDDKRLNSMINLTYYSFVLFLITTPISPALGRLGTYSDMAQMIFFPSIFNLNFNRNSTYLVIIIIVIYFMIRFNGIVNNYYDLYIPYNSVFSRN